MHSSFGLRYLYANLGPYQSKTQIREYVINKNPKDIAEDILKLNPQIVGFGVYIWNTTQTYEVISTLKKVRPDLMVVVGGPEVSFEIESQPLYQIVDYVFKGESDFLFRDFIHNYYSAQVRPEQKIVSGPLPDIKSIASPYPYYSDEDVKNRVIYVEASRGCPYKCEYCLSSLDVSVRNFNIDLFLADMENLIQRGVRQFKFVDRTFNLSPTTSHKILNFFLERIHLGLFLHFELVPDRLPDDLKELIRKFPAGSLQFEIGVQTWNPTVARNVSRRQDYDKIQQNFHFLKAETGVHTHADLIVGLPGETLESFATGFDALSKCEPDEIQVGILKRLKGTPIVRHDKSFQMIYSDHPPFQILQNKDMNFSLLQKFGRFAQYWDLYANSGNFPQLMKFFKADGIAQHHSSLFALFWDFTDFLYAKHGQAHAIALVNLAESAFEYLQKHFLMSEDQAREIMGKDYLRGNKRDRPAFLKSPLVDRASAATPTRQQKHLN